MKNIAIIGGGASGLMLASILSKSNIDVKVVIYEQLEHSGKKILISGNGRCNLSNVNIDRKCFNNEIGYKIACSFDTVSYFESIGLVTYKDDEGRIYPFSNVSNSVLDVLRNSLNNKIEIKEKTKVTNIRINNGKYDCYYNANVNTYDYVVLASGGKTYYSDTLSYKLAGQLNHIITPLHPSLMPLKVSDNLASIENIRANVKASLITKNNVVYEECGEVLFKKDALSGIVIFNLSSYVARNNGSYQVSLDLTNNLTKDYLVSYIENNPTLIGLLPKMLAMYVLKRAKSNSPLDIYNSLNDLRFNVIDNVDFKIAHVTCGGVSLNQVNENLESKINKNLFFAGEILDVDGICGGYNLQFAFASASVVANEIIKREYENQQ